jgi:DNA-directed RNA polymerase subunit RPC12/RpoP
MWINSHIKNGGSCMQYESAKCPNCGAEIPVLSDSERLFCIHCGSRVIVKDAIQGYKVELNGPVVVDTNIESIHKSANGFLTLEQWDDAKRLFTQMIDLDSTDYRGWWGMFLVNTHNMNMINHTGLSKPVDVSSADNAIKSVPESLRRNLLGKYNEYKIRCPKLYKLTLKWGPFLAFKGVDSAKFAYFSDNEYWAQLTDEYKCTLYISSIEQKMLVCLNSINNHKPINDINKNHIFGSISFLPESDMTIRMDVGIWTTHIKFTVEGAKILSAN